MTFDKQLFSMEISKMMNDFIDLLPSPDLEFPTYKILFERKEEMDTYFNVYPTDLNKLYNEGCKLRTQVLNTMYALNDIRTQPGYDESEEKIEMDDWNKKLLDALSVATYISYQVNKMREEEQ